MFVYLLKHFLNRIMLLFSQYLDCIMKGIVKTWFPNGSVYLTYCFKPNELVMYENGKLDLSCCALSRGADFIKNTLYMMSGLNGFSCINNVGACLGYVLLSNGIQHRVGYFDGENKRHINI